MDPIFLCTVSQPNNTDSTPNWQFYGPKTVETHGFMETIFPSIETARQQGYKKVLIWGIAGCQEEKPEVWGSVTSNTQMRRYWSSQMDDFETFINAVKNKLGMPVGVYRGEDNMPVVYNGSGYDRWATGAANPNFSGNEWNLAANRQILVDGAIELARYFDFQGGDAVSYVSLYRPTAFQDFMRRITNAGILYIHEGFIPYIDEGAVDADVIVHHSYCPELGVVDTGTFAPPDVINDNPILVKIMNTERREFLSRKVPGYRQLIMCNGSGQDANATRRAQTLQVLRFCRQYDVVPVANFDLSLYAGQW